MFSFFITLVVSFAILLFLGYFERFLGLVSSTYITLDFLIIYHIYLLAHELKNYFSTDMCSFYFSKEKSSNALDNNWIGILKIVYVCVSVHLTI